MREHHFEPRLRPAGEPAEIARDPRRQVGVGDRGGQTLVLAVLGGDGARTMMLVYNLPATGAVYQRFGGVAGSAYFVGGAWHDRSFRQWHGSSSDPFRNGTAARGQYRLS